MDDTDETRVAIARELLTLIQKSYDPASSVQAADVDEIFNRWGVSGSERQAIVNVVYEVFVERMPDHMDEAMRSRFRMVFGASRPDALN